MKISTLFIINTIVAGIFGLSFLFVAATLMSFYGITLSPGGLVVARLFGAALIGFAVLSWFARNAEESIARGAIVLAFFISDSVGFIIALIGQLSGTVNAFGWSTVAIYLLLALGFGYFQFLKPSGSQ